MIKLLDKILKFMKEFEKNCHRISAFKRLLAQKSFNHECF